MRSKTITCPECFCTLEPENLQKHFDWHGRMNARITQIAARSAQAMPPLSQVVRGVLPPGLKERR
jgi:hypothetical protein